MEQAPVVADDIGYINEVVVRPDSKMLYVNATFTRELLAFDVVEDNTLVNRRVIARFGEGIYPDGLALDQAGQLWLTSIISNTILCVNPETGVAETYLQDADSDHVRWVEAAYVKHALDRQHLDGVKSTVLQNISSLAFSGEDLDIAVLGSLLGKQLSKIRLPHKAVMPAHWLFDD